MLIPEKYLWPKSDAPRYAIAMYSSAAFSAATALTAWVVKVIMIRRNRKMRQEESEVGVFFVY